MNYPILHDPNEIPLSHLISDGGFASIFRRIGCIGDSLASGEFQLKNDDGSFQYHDKYEYSWGQFIARATGARVFNFSKGGMCASYFMEGFGQLCGCWDSDKQCQAYIIALGHNDLINAHQEVGSIDSVDIDNPEKNPKTFAGYYASIIAKLRTLQKDPYFFLMTMPKSEIPHPSDANEHRESHAKLLHEFAAIVPNCFVLDFHKYVTFDEQFRKDYYLNGHMNPCGYLLTAKMIMSYIDYIVRRNPSRFELVGMM